MIKVFGMKNRVLREEQVLDNGMRMAGLGDVSYFVMEMITPEDAGFWTDYLKTMIACAELNPALDKTKKGAIKTAIKGFQNALKLVGIQQTAVFVAYSTLDISTASENNLQKMINIQMCMSVSTTPRFPAVTHMGIFRSPLLSVDLTKIDSLGEIALILRDTPDYYTGKTSGGISLILHSFAARAMVTFSQGFKADLMITAPMPHMGGLLGEVGKITSNSKLSKNPLPPGSLEYGFDQLRFKVFVRYKNKTHTWHRRTEGFLFELAFNSSHKYAPTFTNMQVLRELHQDIEMSSGPYRATVVKV